MLERQELGEAGATWVTDVPPRLFDLAEVPRPAPSVRRGGDHPYLLLDKRCRGTVSLPKNPMWSIDTPRLIAWLHEGCAQQGVTILDRCEVGDPHLRLGRLRTISLRRKGGEARRFTADLFVDAAGLEGSLKAMVPFLSRLCPTPRGNQVCEATQLVYAVKNADRARDFVLRHTDDPETFIAWIGGDGGYSTFAVHVSADLSHVDLLAGVVPAPGRRTSSTVLAEFVEKTPWIGERLMGGGSFIPIRRPHKLFGAGGVALMGDAACQVFPSNGCGVGSALVAARCLAEAAVTEGDPGSAWTFARYQALYHARLGYANVVHDGIRMFSQHCPDDGARRIWRAGFVNSRSLAASLDQRVVARKTAG